MSRSAVRPLVGLLFFTALAAVQPQAEASCFYPRSHTTTYYAYVVDSTGNIWSCTSPGGFGPVWPNHWDVIGETSVDCDGNVYSWGDTTSCTGAGNRVTTWEECDPICE